jgi:hypothetical protein
MHPDLDEPLKSIWEATRPEDPSAEAFDAMWARVVARAEETEPISFSWKKFGLGVAAFSQAAALVLAGGYALMRPAAVVASAHDYQVEGGTTLMVRLDPRGAVSDVVIRPLNDDADTALADLDVLNFMESRSEEVP